MKATAPILVPRRAGDPQRDRLWRWVRGRLELELPDCPIVEGHHDLGPFSRSAALNRAFREAPSSDVVVVLDADTYVDGPQLREAIVVARATGRLTYAFDRLVALNVEGTEKVLAGYSGSWRRFQKWAMHASPSSALVVPRRLWHEVGGFDERFAGWGWEDVAFRRAANVIGGDEVRVLGRAWHLWHPRSPHRSERDPHFLEAKELGARYKSATPAELLELVDEARRDRARTAVVLVANGRREYLERTLPGFRKLVGLEQVERVVVHDDSGDAGFRKWLLEELADVELELVTTERAGYGGAMASAWSAAASTGCPLIFWLEEDFVLGDVPLEGMAELLERRGELAQVVLKRQAWYPRELKAGGMLEGTPGRFVDVEGPYPHVEHRAFFSVNPTLFRAELLARPWPRTKGSEAVFGNELLADQPHRLFALWGSSSSAPTVEHVGVERAGHGY